MYEDIRGLLLHTFCSEHQRWRLRFRVGIVHFFVQFHTMSVFTDYLDSYKAFIFLLYKHDVSKVASDASNALSTCKSRCTLDVQRLRHKVKKPALVVVLVPRLPRRPRGSITRLAAMTYADPCRPPPAQLARSRPVMAMRSLRGWNVRAYIEGRKISRLALLNINTVYSIEPPTANTSKHLQTPPNTRKHGQ
jgi:hypothetical protein